MNTFKKLKMKKIKIEERKKKIFLKVKEKY